MHASDHAATICTLSKECKYVYMDGWMDGWMEGWKDGWMDGWICYVMEVVVGTSNKWKTLNKPT